MVRRVWKNKEELLAGGLEVVALPYNRASKDRWKTEKSVRDQDRLNAADIQSLGWRHGGSYTDNDRSASRWATKEREDYKRLMKDIESGYGDVLVFFEMARGTRDLHVYTTLRKLCMETGLYFWRLGRQLYDLRVPEDRMVLNMLAVQAEAMADSIQRTNARGADGGAVSGRPQGRVDYGYERIYDEKRRGVLVAQVVDDEPRLATAEDGRTVSYSQAEVVETIYWSVVAGISIEAIVSELNACGIPSITGGPWWHSVVRRMAMNPTYIGKRHRYGEIVCDGIWPALVDEETYWASVRVLDDPTRKSTDRSNQARWWLSFIATCGECGSHYTTHTAGKQQLNYVCSDKRRCSSINIEKLDGYVEGVLLAYLSREDVYEVFMRTAASDDRELARARAVIDKENRALDEWRQAAADGGITPEGLKAAESGCLRRIKEAKETLKNAAVPPVLRSLIGADAREKWLGLADLVAVRRDIVRELMDITVFAAGKGRRNVPMSERVRIRFRLEDAA